MDAVVKRTETDSCPSSMHSLIVPVEIYHASNPSKTLRTYALLDNQSNTCFASEELVEELRPPTQEANLRLTTMLETQMVKSQVIKGLTIKGVGQDVEIEMPATYTRDRIPANKTLIPRQESTRKWPHLASVADKLQPFDDDLQVGLLVGFNCSAAMLPK